MGRVGNNDIRLRDGGHHATTGSFTLKHANAPLDLRIAFHFLAFLLQFLTRHLQLVMVVPELEGTSMTTISTMAATIARKL